METEEKEIDVEALHFQPKHAFITGVEFRTINEKNKKLLFCKDYLDSRGDWFRKSRERLDNITKEKAKKVEESESLEKEGKETSGIQEEIDKLVSQEKEQLLDLMCASLSQQYNIAKGKEILPFIEVNAKNLLKTCFTSDIYERFIWSLDMGKEFTTLEMIDFSTKNKGLIEKKLS